MVSPLLKHHGLFLPVAQAPLACAPRCSFALLVICPPPPCSFPFAHAPLCSSNPLAHNCTLRVRPLSPPRFVRCSGGCWPTLANSPPCPSPPCSCPSPLPPFCSTQVRALQLWSLANRNGQFRIYINSRSSADHLQYSTLAFTGGAIYVTVLRWLAELRTKLVKDGPSFFRSRISLSLHKSKQVRASALQWERLQHRHGSAMLAQYCVLDAMAAWNRRWRVLQEV